MTRRSVLFILGAGISRDVLPLSTQLTTLVREGKTGDGRVVNCEHEFRFEDPTRLSPQAVSRLEGVRGRLEWLSGRLTQGANSEGASERPDYEALYFACQQLHDHLREEYENPLLEPFLESFSGALAPSSMSTREQRWWAKAEVRQLREHIACVVAWALKEEAPGQSLDLVHRAILDACADKALSVDIVTLNHDTLLERSLVQAAQDFEDGFERPKAVVHGGTMAKWRGFRRRRGRVRLIKLHGSVDWWRVRREGSDRDVYARMAGEDPTGIGEMSFAIGRSRWVAPDPAPEIIVGAFNKLLEYVRPFHLDSLVVFRRALRAASEVVVSGYSFRDKGVNALLIEWANRNPTSALVVVDPSLNSAEPPSTAHGAIEKKWADWLCRGQLKPVRARFDECAWASLKA